MGVPLAKNISAFCDEGFIHLKLSARFLFQIMLFVILTFSLIIDDLLTSIACFRPVYVFVVKVGTMEIVVLSGMS